MASRRKSSRAVAQAEGLSVALFLPLATIFLLAAMLLLSACNTMQGLGRDVETAGETLTGTSEEVEEEM